MKRLLFVCLGNIIRSPLAEHLFLDQAQEAGVEDKYQVDSAGTAAYHIGEAPDPRMRSTASARGVNYSGRARQIQPEDFDNFDLILAMDRSNERELLALAGSTQRQGKVRLLREFDTVDGDANVPDPYYGGSEGFEATYDIVERSVRGLLEQLEAGEV